MVVEWAGLGLKTEVVSEGNTGALSCTETETRHVVVARVHFGQERQRRPASELSRFMLT